MSFYQFDYCTDVCDGKTGKAIFVQFECQLEIEPVGDDPFGTPQFEVSGVYVDGFNLLTGDALSCLIANRVAAEAEMQIQERGGLWDEIAERLEIPMQAAE